MPTGLSGILPSIPKGYRIFESFSPAGLARYKPAFNEFYEGRDHRFELEPDPSNLHDKNAIRVLGCSSSGKHFIGYIGRDLAKQIAETGALEYLVPRIGRIYRSDSGYVDAQFQLLGPRDKYDDFCAYVDNLPPTKEAKDAAAFYGLNIKKMNRKVAGKLIHNFEMENEGRAAEWTAYCGIIEELKDPEFRKDYEIRKPTKAVLDSAFQALSSRGLSYTDIETDIDLLIDELKGESQGDGFSGSEALAIRKFTSEEPYSSKWTPSKNHHVVKPATNLENKSAIDWRMIICILFAAAVISLLIAIQ